MHRTGSSSKRSSGVLLYVLGRLAHASALDIWRWVSQLPEIPPTLMAPPRLTCVDMITALFPEANSSWVEACRLEFLTDHLFSEALNEKMVEKRRRRVNWMEWHEFLYMAVRYSKPRIVFETGVFDGQSSAIILRALSENRSGELVSIDLPARETIKCSTHAMPETTIPSGCAPGWLVPDYLRARHHLFLGDSKELLPRLLIEYPTIDILFHDSMHTFHHQYFEYSTAWPYLPDGGLLLSDDIFCSSAFHKFCKEKGKRYVRLESFGAVRK